MDSTTLRESTCLLVVFFLLTTAFAENSDVVDVWGVVGGRVELPCPPNPKLQKDQPVLVLWYLSSNTTPVYSYDARLGDFTAGDKWADLHTFGDRSYFSALAVPPSLILEPVHALDEGLYTCRMDYRRSPSTTVTTNLTVIVPPGPPVVLWNGVGVVGSVGPLQENARVIMVCRSSGGSPPPVLTWWWRGMKLSHQTSNVTYQAQTGSLLVESVVRLRATRGLQGALLTCHANPPSPKRPNRNVLLQPRTASVSLNITLPPLEVSITGTGGPVSAGSALQLECRAVGSNPVAELTWWRGHSHLTEVVHSVDDGGNVTIATLMVVTSRDHDGATLACTAINPLLPNVPATRTITLQVLYPPVATLRLGSVLNSSDIEESDDIYFECNVKANPQVHRIEWQHNGVLLQHNIKAGIVMSGLSLALQRLKRRHSGSYTCIAYNKEGRNTSNAFHLTVRHAPQCTGGTQPKTIGAARGTLTKLMCRVEAEPSKDIYWEWTRIREDDTEEKIPDDDVRMNGLTSSIVLTPLSPGDYGYVTCRASNVIGRQREPCMLHLVPSGPPDPPMNCSVAPVNRSTTSSSLAIACLEGFDGGLPQEFLLEVQQEKEVIANLTSEFPEWVVDQLDSGVSVTIRVTAQNAHGKSEALRLEVHTPLAQHREALDASTENQKTLLGATTLLGALVGVVVVLVILIIVSIIIARHARPRPKNKPTIVSTTPVDSNWECYNPDLVSSAQQRQPSLGTLTISQQSLPSPRLQTLMQRHRNPCIPLHESAHSYIQMHKQSVPHIFINNQPVKASSRGELTRFEINDSNSDSSTDSDVESVIEVTDLAAKGLMKQSEENRFHLRNFTSASGIKDSHIKPQEIIPTSKSFQVVKGENDATKPLLTKDEQNFPSPKVVDNLHVKTIPIDNCRERSRKLPKTPEVNRTDKSTSEKDHQQRDQLQTQNKMSLEATPPPKPPRVFNIAQNITPTNSPETHKRDSKPILNSSECLQKGQSPTLTPDSGENSRECREQAPLAEDEVKGAYEDKKATMKINLLNGVAGRSPKGNDRVSPSRETSI